MAKMTQDEKRWRAEDDARTLAQAQEVIVDKPRLTAAKKAAKSMVNEQQKRVDGLKKVVSVKPIAKKATSKTSTSKRGSSVKRGKK